MKTSTTGGDITIAIIDLDCTLLNDKKEISGGNLSALRRWKDADRILILASARPRRVMRNIVKKVGCVDYWICYNGARVYREEQLILDRAMDAGAIVSWISNVMAKYPELVICLEIDDKLYSNKAPTKLFGNTPWATMDIETMKPETRVSKIIIEHSGAIEREIGELRVGESMITDGGTIVQVAPPGTNKKSAVEEILAITGWFWRNCIAFGDDYNDLETLKAAESKSFPFF